MVLKGFGFEASGVVTMLEGGLEALEVNMVLLVYGLDDLEVVM